jgi:uncharacterized phage protein gp47/JayE
MDSKNYEQLVESMKNSMVANQSRITDFNEGSIILAIFQAVARVIENGYIDTRLGYEQNLKAIAYSVFDFTNKGGTYATGNVVFSASAAVTTDIVIAAGTKVSDGEHIYITQETGVISAGSITSNNVSIQAESIGLDYNIVAGAINTIETTVPASVVSVTNNSKISGGTDSESDSQMLERFKKYVNGLQGTSYYGMQAGILALEGVRSVAIVEHFPPVSNYNVTVYVDDGTGDMDDELESMVRQVVEGDGSEQYPGLRPCGINVDIKAAETVNVVVTCTVVISITAESSVIELEVKEKIEEFIDALEIGQSVVWSQVLNAIMSTGVKDAYNLTLNATTGNIVLASNQIARFESAAISVKYEGEE